MEASNRTVLVNAVVLQSLYSNLVTPLQPACAGTRCDWPLYNSAAFCSSCENAIDDIIIEPKHDPVLQAYTDNDYLGTFQGTDLNLDDSGLITLKRSNKTSYVISLGVGSPVQFNLSSSAEVMVTVSNSSSLRYPESIVWDLYDLPPSNKYPDGYHCYTDASRLDNFCFDYQNTTINGIPGPLKAFGYVKLVRAANGSRLVASSAQRCVLTLCAQRYTSTFHNGSLLLNITDKNFGYYDPVPIDPRNAASNAQTLNWYAFQNKSAFRAGVLSSTDYNVLVDFLMALNNLEGTSIRWTSTGDPSINNGFPGTGTINPRQDVVQFMSNVQNNTAKIALGLSNFVQENGDSQVVGQAYASVPFVEVRWAWLAYPLALVTIGTVALIATMYQTKRQRLALWKSSPFPLLFNYHDHDACAGSDGGTNETSIPQAAKTSKHEEMAEETQILLRTIAGSWTFEKKS